MQAMEVEVYLGGFSSPHLIRGMMRGYEIHITNHRIIGVKNRKAGAGWLLGAGAIGAVGGAIAEKMASEQAGNGLEELEEKKDFDIPKGEIFLIEVKKPSMIRTGHLLLTPTSGEPVKLKIGDKRAYEQTIGLMRRFYPEALRLLD